MTHNQTPDDAAPADTSPDERLLAAASDGASALSPEAVRALAEAEERRRAAEVQNETAQKPVELGGRAGPDPVRYGDWEKGGIVSDF